MRLIWLAATLATLAGSVSARGLSDFRVNQPFRLVATDKPSPIEVTQNTLRLQRADAGSLSSGYLEAIRAGNHVDGVYSRLQNGSAQLLSVNSGSVFLAPLTAGAQSFSVVIDTGSSDTWLVNSQFTCVDPNSGATVAETQCSFGPTYTVSPTANQVANRNFNISYADGERLNGGILTENLTFGGISVSQQTMGQVTIAGWYGDGVSSGLVGLAYSTLTNQYAGTNPSADVAGANIPYAPLFTTMYTTGLTAPLFSIALDRDRSHSAQASGGILALGGIPNIAHGSFWATTNISVVGIDSTTGSPTYQFYSIVADGWAISASKDAEFDVSGTGNPRKTPLVGAPTRNTVVDSGTSLIYAPSDVASAVAAAFSPPATMNAATGLYQVDCSATAPLFGVVIQKKVFYVNGFDLNIDTGAGFCITGVQDSGGGLTILGDVFLRNVLAVFDIGAAQIRFSARANTSTNGSFV